MLNWQYFYRSIDRLVNILTRWPSFSRDLIEAKGRRKSFYQSLVIPNWPHPYYCLHVLFETLLYHYSIKIYVIDMFRCVLHLIASSCRCWLTNICYIVLCSFLDLPNLSASIYSTDLSNRLRAFLVACPPSGPSPTVAELVIATADFQRDLSSWNIR